MSDKRKREIRARMRETGENYTVAARAVDAIHAARQGSASSAAADPDVELHQGVPWSVGDTGRAE